MRIRALFFDVFGTLVDWRTSMMRAILRAYGPAIGEARAFALADAWRQQYFGAIERVRTGVEAWRPLDDVHATILPAARSSADLPPLDAEGDAALVAAWHQLDPWPDSVEGLARLRRCFVVAPVSNASFSQMVAISRHAGFVWDAILGAQLARNFKTHPSVYLASAAALDLAPAECLMVAAHNADLAGARAAGLRTAFVLRPCEFGPAQASDLTADTACDFATRDLVELADMLETASSDGAPAGARASGS